MPKTQPAKASAACESVVRGDETGSRHSRSYSLPYTNCSGLGAKITLKAVTDEAKVSSSLINNRYSDFAEKVRALSGKAIRQQRDEKAVLLTGNRTGEESQIQGTGGKPVGRDYPLSFH
jgi:hypothetical protein